MGYVAPGKAGGRVLDVARFQQIFSFPLPLVSALLFATLFTFPSLSWATDTTNPTSAVVTTPVHNSNIQSLTAISGTATDDTGGSGINRVYVILTRSYNGMTEYWGLNGGVYSWSTNYTPIQLTVTPLNGQNVTWSLNTNLPSGANLPSGVYTVRALAYDANNNSLLSSPTTFIYNIGAPDTTVPTSAVVTTPIPNTNISVLNSISGTATDNTGGSGINRMYIFLWRVNGGTTEYWSLNSGVYSWSTAANSIQTNLTPLNGQSVNWSLNNHLPSGADLPLGTYSVRALAYDAGNNYFLGSTVTFNVTAPDTTNPTSVVVTVPTNNSNIQSLTAISGTATDNTGGSGINRVYVILTRSYNDITEYWGLNSGVYSWSTNYTPIQLGVSSTNSLNVTWSMTSNLPSGSDLPSGVYTVRALAYDANNNSLLSSPTTFIYNIGAPDTTVPTSSVVTTPAQSSNIPAIFSVGGTATDNTGGSGINRMYIFLWRVNGGTTEYWSLNSGVYSWSTTPNSIQTNLTPLNGQNVTWSLNNHLPSGADLPLGTYSVRALAYDAGNNYFLGSTVTFNVVTPAAMPGAPVVDDVTSNSVDLTMPALPAGTNSLTLQRLTDSTSGATLPPLGNLKGWYKADSLSGVNGSSVNAWPDSSGAGNHAAQVNSDWQPSLVNNAVNGKPALHFEGVGIDTFNRGDSFQLPSGMRDLTSGFSTFVVTKPSGVNLFLTVVDYGNFSPSGSNRSPHNSVYFGVLPGESYYEIHAGGQLAGGGVSDSVFQILGVIQQGGATRTPSTATMYRNGAITGSGSVLVPDIVDRTANFIGMSTNSSYSPFLGDIAEILVYDTALTLTQRQTLEDYLSRKYGISANNAPANLAWTTIATGLAGNATYTDSGLASDTRYWYRCLSVDSTTTSLPSPVAMAVTLPAAPAAPAAPTFDGTSPYSIAVVAPALPARATHLRLQQKLPNNTWTDVADNLPAGAHIIVRTLRPDASYEFRYVGVGRGGETNGSTASETTDPTDVTGNGTGLRGFYFNGNFAEEIFNRLDATLNFNWGTDTPDPRITTPQFSVRWLGEVEAQVTGTHTFYFAYGPYDTVKVWVNDQLIVVGESGVSAEQSGTIDLTAGQKYSICIDYSDVNYDSGGTDKDKEGTAQLRWACTSASLAKTVIPQAQLYPVVLPDVPAAPIFDLVGPTSVVVSQEGWPRGAYMLSLEKKESRDTHGKFVEVISNIGPGEKTTVSDLAPERQYSFRYVAYINAPYGHSNGLSAEVSTRPYLPQPPETPIFTNNAATQITVKAPGPDLPAYASALKLQKSIGDTAHYADVATDLAPGTETVVTGLSLGVTYYFRYAATNPYGSAEGQGLPITTMVAPSAPPAPVFPVVGTTSAKVNKISNPANATSVKLQRKLAGAPDSSYVDSGASFYGASPVDVNGLLPATTYTFRYIAYNEDNFNNPTWTPGPTTDITTLNAPPDAPQAPLVSNVGLTSLTITTPALPARAESLTLQKKLTANADNTYANVETLLGGLQEVAVTGLTANTNYSFRMVAVNAEGSTSGPGVAETTGNTAPGALGAPKSFETTFNSVLTANVIVEPPAFPADTLWLKLQIKESTQADSEYRTVGDMIADGIKTTVYGLYPGTTYTFRYVALGEGGETIGTAANLAISAATTSWATATPISCAGIILPVGTPTIDPSAELSLSSAPASDLDERIVQVGGVTVITQLVADPCTYTWTVKNAGGVAAGSFVGGRNTGQSVTWVAPSTPGTYTVTLTVDDRNSANKTSAEGGSRDDAPVANISTKTVIVD